MGAQHSIENPTDEVEVYPSGNVEKCHFLIIFVDLMLHKLIGFDILRSLFLLLLSFQKHIKLLQRRSPHFRLDRTLPRMLVRYFWHFADSFP